MTYRTGDIPAVPLVVVPTVAGNALSLDPFESVGVTLLDPYGVNVPGVTASITDGATSVEWPTTSPFAQPGIYGVQLVFANTDGAVQSADRFPVVVEIPDGWHTLATARAGWTTGAPRSDLALYNILQTAKVQVAAFAPALLQPVPQNYRDAQLLQARNSWNAIIADPSSSDDTNQFAPVRPFPLDRWVKALVRPVQGVPRFG